MNIQSISIVPETVPCNAACKYCIASMTETPKTGKSLSLDRLADGLMYAKAGGAQTAIITSKGETLLSDWDYLGSILKTARDYGFGQRDLHSNMQNVVGREDEFLEKLVDHSYGLTNEKSKKIMRATTDYDKLFKFLKQDCNITVRLSCVLNKEGVYDKKTIEEYICAAREKGIDQIVFRGLSVPKNSKQTKVHDWSLKNKVEASVAAEALEEMVSEGKAHKIFELPWGAAVYDANGTNVSTSAKCSETTGSSMKSVIFLPDNHLYSDWEYKGSIIF